MTIIQDPIFAKRASDLVGLLIDWVDYCFQHEEHNGKVIGKRFANLKEEKQAYDKLQGFVLQPLIAKCAWTLFDLNDLREIIPPGFETTWEQRRDLLKDLKTWSIKEFGEYVIPF